MMAKHGTYDILSHESPTKQSEEVPIPIDFLPNIIHHTYIIHHFQVLPAGLFSNLFTTNARFRG